MNQNYYPIDFEAQYEETSEKMIEIASKFKDRIKTLKPTPLEHLEQQLDDLQARIDDRDLQFRKESIYSQFASGQLMAERRKQPPEMCPECGEELKKQAQCEFCAEIFCVKCCSRKRVIPFISKQIRLCCEPCHWKFVKLFDNKSFYEEKEKLANVIHFVKNKVVKINEKVLSKNQEVQEYKKVKRDEKIKEKAIDSKITQEEKKLKQIEEELRKVVFEKAEQMKEEERRRQREEEERQKARRAQEERERQEQLQRQREQQARKREQQRVRKQKELEQQLKLSSSQKKLQAEAQERDLLQLLKRKEEELRRRQEELLKKEQDIKKQIEQSEEKSVKSSVSIKQADTPKQSIGNNSSEREKFIDTAQTKSVTRSRRESEEITKKPLPRIENLVRTESSKSNVETSIKKVSILDKQPQPKIEEQQPTDSLERSLVNMFKPKKEDDAKSVISNVSKTSKSILDMSINQLLAVRIPVARAPSKIEQEEKPTAPLLAAVAETAFPTEEEAIPERKSMVDRRSIKVQQVTEQVKEEEVRMHKDEILRSSSLISSTNKRTAAHEDEVMPQKCACEIM